MFKVEEQGPMTPRNGVYIVQGEMSLVVAALRRNTRGGSHSHQVKQTNYKIILSQQIYLLKANINCCVKFLTISWHGAS